MKQTSALLLAISFLFILNSCTQTSKEKETESAALTSTPPYLYSLYLENTTTHAWFDTLMRRVKAIIDESGHNKKGNLVFRFIHAKDGSLSMVVSVGRRNRRNWDTTFFTLEQHDCGGTVPTMNNKKVFLGNLEIKDFDSNIDTLLTIAANHVDYKYVLFKPTLVPDTSTASYTIQYAIDFGTDPSDVCSSIKFTTGTFQANPSPPKNGN